METNDIQGRVLELAKRRDADGFELAALLCSVRYDIWWDYWGFDSLTEYTRSLPFSTGTTVTFSEIGAWLGEVVNVDADIRRRVLALGWQTARRLYRIADDTDIGEWVAYAEESTWTELCDHVRREEKIHGLRGPKAVRSYWMDDNQFGNIERAIVRELRELKQAYRKKGAPAKGERAPTKSDALEVICLRSMKRTPAQKHA